MLTHQCNSDFYRYVYKQKCSQVNELQEQVKALKKELALAKGEDIAYLEESKVSGEQNGVHSVVAADQKLGIEEKEIQIQNENAKEDHESGHRPEIVESQVQVKERQNSTDIPTAENTFIIDEGKERTD